jgi:hypothetical protein
MAKASTIETLPADILEQLQALLRDPRITQMHATQRINAILSEQGAEPVSKSAVNRYAVKMDKIGAKLTQSRAIADMWIGKLGNEPQGQTGKLLNEVVRNLAFDAAMHMAEDEEPADPKLIKELSIAIEKLESAASKNEARDALIRKQANEAAAEKATEIAKRSGLSADAIAAFKREMLGVPA